MKNNKGFMLAEVVVTSTVVLASLISLYTTFNRLYNKYNTRLTYFDIDGSYINKGMIDYLIRNGKLNEYLKNNINTNNNIKNYLNDDDYFNALKDTYNIENMYIIEYNTSAINGLKNTDINETFKDYCDFMKKYYKLDNNNEYNYLIVTEYKNNDKYYYSSMGIG